MKIIALADTHIRYGSIKESLPADLVGLLMDADMIIHAGDFVTRGAFEEFSNICRSNEPASAGRLPACPSRLVAVHGNMDEPALKELLPERAVIEVEGIRIGIVHEAALSLQDAAGAWYMAKEMSVDVLIFGHIHRPLIEKSDVLLACPGSPTFPRLSEPSALELIIEDGKISGKIIIFEGTACGAVERAKSFR